jgi:hypothetical protein
MATVRKATPKKRTPQKKTVKKTTAKKTTPKKPIEPSKAEQLVAGVHVMHDEALELAESVLFMAAKLEESRKAMQNEPLVVPYDNGGGQSGIRENPHFTAYEKLMATYSKSLRHLAEIVEKGAPVRDASKIMAKLTDIAGRKLG